MVIINNLLGAKVNAGKMLKLVTHDKLFYRKSASWIIRGVVGVTSDRHLTG